jgi:hypothetical protein
MSQQTLDHDKLERLLAECRSSGNYSALKQTLWEVFSSQESLGNSWSNQSIAGSGASVTEFSAAFSISVNIYKIVLQLAYRY